MAKERYESNTLSGLVDSIVSKDQTIRVQRDLPFDHKDIRQVSVKAINPGTKEMTYFNAYKKEGEEVWSTGKPSTCIIKDAEKAQKDMTPIKTEKKESPKAEKTPEKKESPKTEKTPGKKESPKAEKKEVVAAKK